MNKKQFEKIVFPNGAFAVDVNIEQRSQILSLGRTAANFAAILTIITVNSLDTYLIYAAYCFVISLPLSLCSAMISWNVISFPATTKLIIRSVMYLGIIGSLILFAGITLMLCHISEFMGIVFAAITLIGFVLFQIHAHMLTDINRKSTHELYPPKTSK